jgi:hypothetical protein
VLSPSLRSYALGNATLLPVEETEMRVLCFLLRGNVDVAEELTRSETGRWRDSCLMYEAALGNGELQLLRRRSVVGGDGKVETVVVALGGRGETDSVHSAISIPRDWAWRVFSASASALRKICDGGSWKDGDGGGKEGDGGTAGSGMVAQTPSLEGPGGKLFGPFLPFDRDRARGRSLASAARPWALGANRVARR